MRRRARLLATLAGAAACRVGGALAIWLLFRLVPSPDREALHANVVFAGLFALLIGLLLYLREAVEHRDAVRPVRIAAAIGVPLLASMLGLLPAYALYAACGHAGHALLTGSALQRAGNADGFVVFVGSALARLLWASVTGAACGLGRLRTAEWAARGRSAVLGGALGAGLGSLVYEGVLASHATPVAAGAALGLLVGLGVELAEWLGPVAWLADTEGREWGLHAPRETVGDATTCSLRLPVRSALTKPSPRRRLLVETQVTWCARPPALLLRRADSEADESLPDGARVTLGAREYAVRWNRLRVTVARDAATQAVPGETARASAAALVVLSGASAGRRFELREGASSLGSARASDLVLPDPSIAPLHVTVLVREGEVTVRDEGGGLLVGGTSAATATLADGARLRLGEVEMILLTGSEATE